MITPKQFQEKLSCVLSLIDESKRRAFSRGGLKAAINDLHFAIVHLEELKKELEG